jgi:hypothetical protein
VYGNRPTIAVFLRPVNNVALNAQAASLVREIERVVDRNRKRGVAAFVVLMCNKREQQGYANQLAGFARTHQIKYVPLTIYDDGGGAGPPGYAISGQSEVSVMMWVDLRVRVNYAYRGARFNAQDTRRIIADILRNM